MSLFPIKSLIYFLKRYMNIQQKFSVNIPGRFYGEKMNLCVKKQDNKLASGFFYVTSLFQPHTNSREKLFFSLIINPVIKSYFLKISINFGFSIILSVNPFLHINHMMLYTKGVFYRLFSYHTIFRRIRLIRKWL